MPFVTWFGSYIFEIKCISASAWQCVAFAVCERVDIWMDGLMAYFENASAHLNHSKSDVFVEIDRWQ